MKIPLQNVSIKYSDILPRVTLNISTLSIDLESQLVQVTYSHTLPTSSLIESEILLDSGVIKVPLTAELNQMIMNMMQNHIATSYGNV